MDITIKNPILPRTVRAVSSKSDAHRLLICASLAKGETRLYCPDQNEDIRSTVRVLRAMGAKIEEDGAFFRITPIGKPACGEMLLDCGESGSTLRFLLPAAAALGIRARFTGQGRLLSRPMEPLLNCLSAHGAFCEPGENEIRLRGRLQPGIYEIEGNTSSQYISGLLFALSILGGENTIRCTTELESAPYVDMTLSSLSRFGVKAEKTGRDFIVRSGFGNTPGLVEAQGDWSNAAFWLVGGAIGKTPVTVTGLDPESPQGDKTILDILRRFGADVEIDGDAVTVYPAALRGIEVDAGDIPDLVLVICAAAVKAQGETRIRGAGRLRLKESDRIESVYAMLRAIGADAQITQDGLRIFGGKQLPGGIVDGANDHRIVMSAAIAALVCSGEVTICGAQAVRKSYPDFFSVYFGENKG